MATAYVYRLWLVVVLLVGAAALGCASSWKGSVGAVLGKDNRSGRIFVREAPPGLPADRAGIRVDDEIVAIEDAPVQKMSPEEVHAKLSGDVGTKVRLTLRRAGEPTRDVVVERGPLRSETRP
jgi:C-terminal processing protease CtpA/Prc